MGGGHIINYIRIGAITFMKTQTDPHKTEKISEKARVRS
jgi:hypothetical protein